MESDVVIIGDGESDNGFGRFESEDDTFERFPLRWTQYLSADSHLSEMGWKRQHTLTLLCTFLHTRIAFLRCP